MLYSKDLHIFGISSGSRQLHWMENKDLKMVVIWGLKCLPSPTSQPSISTVNLLLPILVRLLPESSPSIPPPPELCNQQMSEVESAPSSLLAGVTATNCLCHLDFKHSSEPGFRRWGHFTPYISPPHATCWSRSFRAGALCSHSFLWGDLVQQSPSGVVMNE